MRKLVVNRPMMLVMPRRNSEASQDALRRNMRVVCVSHASCPVY